MLSDAHGLQLSNSDARAVAAFDHAVSGFLKYRADLPGRLAALLEAAPGMVMAQVLKGNLVMLSFKAANLPAARAALAAAQAIAADASSRERGHIAALAAWIDGELARTLAIWEDILAAHPADVLAFRLHHFLAFWMGECRRMARAADAAVAALPADRPGYGTARACRAFALEELGDYPAAERDGRIALAIDRGYVWAAHAVAHVMEMQGRGPEGVAFLDALEPEWVGANNLTHHLWWHRGLYHFEAGDFAAVLDLYDRRFRNPASPLMQAQPDVYIDVQNAVSMLFRLQRQGVDVGPRWDELADKAEARIGDCLSAFTLPHWMLALAATRRFEAAGRMIAAMEVAAVESTGTVAPLLRDLALPISRAALARARGEPGRACDLMRPALAGMARLGGSHAQQDVLEQLFLDCALAANRSDDVALILARASTRFEMPPSQRRGWREAAARAG